MDRKEVEFSESTDPSINIIMGITYSETPMLTGPKPITIFHDNEAARTKLPKVSIPILVVEVPKPFPYESQKVIPWDYNYNYTHQTTVMTSLVLEVLPGVDVVMPQVWQNQSYLKSFYCLQMKNNTPNKRSDSLKRKKAKTKKLSKVQISQ